MDRVRFGRALGYGARHAAKTLTRAIDAASSPGPAQRSSASASARRQAGEGDRPSVVSPPVQQRAGQAIHTLRNARRASGSLLQPVKRFSSVLWLQVTGTFFSLIAVTMAMGAWRVRGALHKAANSHEAMKLYVFLAVFAIFAYFAISSFVRAERR